MAGSFYLLREWCFVSIKPKEIRTEDLRLEDVPILDDEWDHALICFALSFNGYCFMKAPIDGFGPYADLCNRTAEAFSTQPQVVELFNITGLRALLFFEQRRARWLDEWEITPYVRALVTSIRRQIAAKPGPALTN